MEEKVDEVFDNNHVVQENKSQRNSSKLHYRHRAQSIIQFQSLDQLEDEVTHGYYETTPPKEGSRKRVITIELLYGFYWWMCFNNLSSLFHKDSPLLLWQQLLLVVVLVAIVTSFACVGVLQRLCSTPFGLLCLRIISLTLLVHNLFSEPVWLVIVGVLGGGACILTITCGLWNLSLLDRYRRIHFHLLSFIALQIIHFQFIEPFQLTSRWIQVLLVIAPLIAIIAFLQDYRTPLVTRDDLLSNSTKKSTPSPAGDGYIEWVWLGVGFGCHLYIAWSVFRGNNSGSGILFEWMTINSSIATKVLLIAVLCVGMLLSSDTNLLLILSPQWLIMGLLSCVGFIYYISSVTILGAIMTSLHLMSLWPQLYYRLSEGVAHIVFPVAVGTYLIGILISQVSVGGVGFHGYGVLCSMALEWYGLKRWLPLGESLGKVKIKRDPAPVQRKPSYTLMVGHMIRRLSTVVEQFEEEEGSKQDNTIHQRRLQELLTGQENEMRHFEVKKLRKIMISLVILALLSSAAIG